MARGKGFSKSLRIVDVLTREWPKWWQTMKLQWSNRMAYKLNFLFMLLGPSIVFFFIKYNIWSAIFELRPDQAIQGYTFSKMINYQVWVFVVGLLAQAYNSMDLAVDIRLGRISTYLIYPFNFWQFHSANFLAFQILQLFVASFSVALIYFSGLFDGIGISNYLLGLAYCSLVGIFWFTVQFAIGLMAFWLDQTWVLRVMFLICSSFLSGGVIPLEIFPHWLMTSLMYSPFPYITYIPVKIFMGAYFGNIAAAAAILLFWTLLSALFGLVVWRRGLKLYTAAGM